VFFLCVVYSGAPTCVHELCGLRLLALTRSTRWPPSRAPSPSSSDSVTPDRGRGGARRVPAAPGAAPRLHGVPPRAGPPLLRRPAVDPRWRDISASRPSTSERRGHPGSGARPDVAAGRPGTLGGRGGL